jgi:hypothetical protein
MGCYVRCSCYVVIIVLDTIILGLACDDERCSKKLVDGRAEHDHDEGEGLETV